MDSKGWIEVFGSSTIIDEIEWTVTTLLYLLFTEI